MILRSATVDETSPLLSEASRNPLVDKTESQNAVTYHDDDDGTSKIESAECDDDSVEEGLSNRQLVLIIGSGYLGIVLAALDGTMVATLTESISGSFDAATLLSWLASSYFIAMAVLQPLAGKLTDIYGRRAGLIFCNVLFCLGNLMCGLAPGEITVIFGRIVAGLGAGGLHAIPLFVANDLIPTRRRAMWQGLNNVCYGVGAGLGGIFGGGLNDTVGWRWAFFALAIMTMMSTVLVTWHMKIPRKARSISSKDEWKRIDFLGSITLTLAIVFLCVGFNTRSTSNTWTSPIVFTSLILSVLFLFTFIYIESHIAAEPVIPVRLFLNRTVVAACLTTWFFSMAQLSIAFYSPIYIQVKGTSATTTGLYLIPGSIGAAMGGVITGYVIRQTGRYYILNIIIQITFLVPVALASLTLSLTSPCYIPMIYFFWTGFAYWGKLTITVTALIAAVDQDQAALVTSAAYAFRSTGATIGVTISSLVYETILTEKLYEKFSDFPDSALLVEKMKSSLGNIWKVVASSQHHINTSANTANGSTDEDNTALSWIIKRSAQEAYMDALRGVFTTIFWLALMGTVASLFMREYTLHRDMARSRR